MKRKVKLVDLKHFLDEGGALFLGVQMNVAGDEWYYCAQLLPYDIKKRLKGTAGQKTVTLDLKRIGTEPNKLIWLFKRFLDNRARQLPTIGMPHLSEQDIIEGGLTINGEPTYYVDLPEGVNGTTLLSPFELDTYAYVTTDSGLTFPVDHLSGPEGVVAHAHLDAKVIANGRTVYEGIELEESTEGQVLHFGDGFTLRHDDGAWNIDYVLPSLLNERIRGEKAMLDFLTTDALEVGRFVLKVKESNHVADSISERQGKIALYEDVSKALSAVGVNEQLDLSGMTYSAWNEIISLVKVLLYGRKFVIRQQEDSVVMDRQFSNLLIKLICRRADDGNYVATSYFDENYAFAEKLEDGRMLPVSVYSTLTQIEIETLSNLDFSKVPADISRFSDADQLAFANLTLLKLISAYDKTNRQVIIDAATSVASWLHSENPDEMSYYLNYLQVKKRAETLTDADLRSVMRRIETGTLGKQELIAAYIILGNKDMAFEHLEELQADERASFEAYPIYNLI